MVEKTYIIPEIIIDKKEEHALVTLTEEYNKMIEPSRASKLVGKIGEKLPASIKDAASATKEKITENELFLKSMEVVGKGLQTLEQYAAKITLSEKQIIEKINPLVPNNEITSLDEICLARAYDISNLVSKMKNADVIAAIVEGAATGAPGFVGLPFNLVLSTFLYYRAVQSVALFYGYDIKNDPAELTIASEVFINAMNPKNANDSELSGTIAKIMLLSTTTTVKQTVNKGWQAMADKGGVCLLITQMRALANNAARKAVEKVGKNNLENKVFTEVCEQIGKKLSKKAIERAIPYVGAVIGATIDTAQMIKILKYADIFYHKRFILEKEMRINMLVAPDSEIIIDNYTEEYEFADTDTILDSEDN